MDAETRQWRRRWTVTFRNASSDTSANGCEVGRQAEAGALFVDEADNRALDVSLVAAIDPDVALGRRRRHDNRARAVHDDHASSREARTLDDDATRAVDDDSVVAVGVEADAIVSIVYSINSVYSSRRREPMGAAMQGVVFPDADALLRYSARMKLRARIEKKLANAFIRLPRSWLVALSGGRRRDVDGFILDEQAQFAMAMHKRMGKKLTHELDIEGARAELEASAAVLAPRTRRMARVENRRADGIPVRIYVPLLHRDPAPALVYYHGGGFALGSLDSHDTTCRILAEDGHCIVVAVDYRLAPEHKFPAAVEDAIAAFRWVRANADKLGIDPNKVAVGGDSAGGNLAAVVAAQTREPAFQLLIYPATDFTMSSPSIRQMGRGFFLEHDTMVWFREHYLRSESDRRDPRASPLFAERVEGLAPAFVATAGFDPLRDEGEAYANKLRDAGVPVTYRCYRSLFHGFFSASGGLESARAPLVEAAAALRDALK